MPEPQPEPGPTSDSPSSSRRTEQERLRSAETMASTDAVWANSLPPASTDSDDRRYVSPRWPLWLLIFLFLLVMMRVTIPYLAEQVAYSSARGKQRAEAEAAATELDGLKLAELSRAYQLVSKRVAPSVVHIRVAGYARAAGADEFGWLFRRETHEGSGVIVDSDGFVVTNAHVVQGATDILVSLSDGREVAADIMGVDVLTDLAVLQIRAGELIPAEWGDSDELEVGALVWAVGSPFGLQRSITSGIISAKNRGGMTSRYQDFLQTDAAVNPGNSGGPLVDAQGRVVGINAAIVGDSYQGIGFAIPSNVVRDVYQGLREKGRVDRGWLGVGLDDVSPELAQRLGLKSQAGALIVEVHTDPRNRSPAQRAGLRREDVIIRWNGAPVRDSTSFSLMVAQTDPDTTVEAIVIRRGQRLSLSVTVGRRPSIR
ncbi:MAG: S1C family serine protease [Pirellulaceae bacterium]